MFMCVCIYIYIYIHVEKFHTYLNSRLKNMTLTHEVEQNNCISFLDVLVTREDVGFSTSVYRKPTFSGLYTPTSLIFSLKSIKKGLIFSLLLHIFIFTIAYSKCPGLWSLKNIWLNLQFSLFMSVFKTFFILNAFHCEFLAFCFQLSKAQLFLLRLLLGLNSSFVAKLEVGSWISQMDYFMFWWFKPITFHLILHTQRSLVITNPGLLWSHWLG